jgi:hypothetical protein
VEAVTDVAKKSGQGSMRTSEDFRGNQDLKNYNTTN